MANGTSKKSAKVGRPATAGRRDVKATAMRVAARLANDSKIRFTATLLRPASTENPPAPKAVSGGASGGGSWTFLTLPKQASAKLPSRSRVSVEGTINGSAFQATLEPDGNGGHWLKVDQKIWLPLPLGEGWGEGVPIRSGRAAGVPGLKPGDKVTLEIAPLPPEREPEPEVPADLKEALAAATAKARETWADITPIARRDWIHWITSGKRAETRIKRIDVAISKLSAGDRRPCCFDRSGMYDKSLSCPVAE